ncbi:MAG: efflux RND transporter permease subunit [Ignavibacteriales bacterium]|nr:efflux RND transporter permease subunit [Ignavibacteriales bacterium]
MTITELSIKRPTLVIVVFTILGVLGLFSYNQLKYELLPKITPPFLVIITAYPGASPQEVETSVTKVLEDAVSGIDKVSTVYATSQEGVSIVSLEFSMKASISVALQDVQRKVNEVSNLLPSGSKTPSITKFALDELPVLRMGVTARMPSRDFYQLLDDRIQPRLAKLAGVGQITLVGGDEREIKVNVDPQKLRSYGLSLLQVTQLIKSSNMDFPTGKVKDGDYQYIVRLAGKYNSIDELRTLVVGQPKQGGDIRLADIAEVEDGRKDYSTLSRINGKTSIGILVQKQGEANSVEVSQIVRAELAKLEKDYTNIGLKFEIAQDGSIFTTDAADAVKHDLMLAIIFVAVVMLAFLHSIRNSVIVMIAIPTSLITTFIAIYAFGFTLNLMTLLGLSLVIGILVDDSIVVLENIYRHLEKGDERKKASLRGRNEIGFAALSITLVDVVVFVPLALVSGIVGNILREFALVVVFSTLMSLFVSFTITPMLASRFAKLERQTRANLIGKFAVWFEAQYHKFAEEYQKILRWGLKHRGKVALISLVLFIASFALIPLGFIGTEFMTPVDRGEFTVTMELPPGSTLEHTNYIALQAEKIVSAIPEVQKMYVNAGVSTEGFIGQSSNNVAEINVTLIPKELRNRSTDDISSEIRSKIYKMPGVKVRVSPIGIFGTANQSPVQIAVSGTDYNEVRAAASKLSSMVKSVRGTADVRLSSEEGKPETRIEIDREKMADLGLNLGEVGAGLRTAFNGDDDSKFRDGASEYPIRIILDQFDRTKTSDIQNLTFLNRKGQMIELKQFASTILTTGPTKLQRQDRNYSVIVYSQVIGRPAGDVASDIKKEIARKGLPPEIIVTYLGDEKNRSEGFGDLGLALMAAILFVYLIMVALFDSFIYPFIVLFSIPVAMIGALLTLALTGKALSIFTILGIIMLVGLVGKNAILLVDRTNQMREEQKLSVHDALLEAGNTRLRPILMTTASMIVAMFPIATSLSSGSEWKSGLALALIGGLTSSLLLTLVLVPVVYTKVDEWKETVPAFIKKFYNKVTKKKINDTVPDVVATASEK